METFLAYGGAVVLGANLINLVYKFLKPGIVIKKDIEHLKGHDKKDLERLDSLEKLSKAQCRMLLVMIDHMIDGNSIDNMKNTRNQIIDLITEE